MGTVMGARGLAFDKVEYAAPRFRCEDELLHLDAEARSGGVTMVQHLLLRVMATRLLDTPGLFQNIRRQSWAGSEEVLVRGLPR